MVWVGSIALALGGIFLVRYTIEQGLIGPRARIALGALLALLLIAAGEWQRRSEKVLAQPSLPGANIPSILTAVALYLRCRRQCGRFRAGALPAVAHAGTDRTCARCIVGARWN
ncbi:MAG: DUF2339 domain-containing protein, partial [Xanthobacteraceae bacterium]